MNRRAKWLGRLGKNLFFMLVMVVAAGAQTKAPAARANLYSVEKEAALGAGMAEKYRAQVRVLETASLRAYLGGVVARLEPQFGSSAFPFRVAVTDDAAGAEAVVLPGGYIFVGAGLVGKARDEGEFARVLAHAMTHVSERHDTQLVTRSGMMQLATIPAEVQEKIVPAAVAKMRMRFETDAEFRAGAAVAGWRGDAAGFGKFRDEVRAAAQK